MDQYLRASEPVAPVWAYFGYDKPNYTYAPNGKKLLVELSELSPTAAVQIRMHNLLTSGDGNTSPKMGINKRLQRRLKGSQRL